MSSTIGVTVIVALLAGGGVCHAQPVTCGPDPATPVTAVYVVLSYVPGEPRLEDNHVSGFFGTTGQDLTMKTANEWFIDFSTLPPSLPTSFTLGELQNPKVFKPAKDGWEFTPIAAQGRKENGRCVARIEYRRSKLWRVTVTSVPGNVAVPILCSGEKPACSVESPTPVTTNSLPVDVPIQMTMKFTADTICWWVRNVSYRELTGERRELAISKDAILAGLREKTQPCTPWIAYGRYASQFRVPSNGMLIHLDTSP